MKKISVKDILKRKKRKKISMLTCYDYAFAHILDQTGVDIILVGDSLANVVLGLDETRKVSLKEMLNHTQAVAKATKRALVVSDMPAVSFRRGKTKALEDAKNFIKAGAEAVKVEWFKGCEPVIKRLIKNKIPVMGHIGLTPQTAHLLGGYKVQGKTKESALRLIKQAKILEDLGCFSVVLECIPYQLSCIITKEIRIPTIGIGAGKYCDGQVLVLYDLLGLYERIRPKFVKVFKDLGFEIKKSVNDFVKEVQKSRFPSKNQSFSMKPDQLSQILPE